MIKSLFATELTDVVKTDIEGIGSLRYAPDGKVYRWVKSTAVAALVAHQPVCFDDAEGIAAKTGLVTKILEPAGDSQDMVLFAGVTVAAWAIPTTTDPQFGWIQIYGFHADAEVVVDTSTAAVIGDILIMQTGTGTTTAAFLRETAVGNASAYAQHAICLEAISASALTPLNVFIKAL